MTQASQAKLSIPMHRVNGSRSALAQSEPLRLNIQMLSKTEPCSSAVILRLKYHNKLRIVGKFIMLLPLHRGSCALE